MQQSGDQRDHGVDRFQPLREQCAAESGLAQRVPRGPGAGIRTGTWWWTASTSGSTRTRRTISACSATRRLRFPSSGTARRFPATPSARSMPNYHGLTAFVVMSHVAARFFEPQVSGIGATPRGVAKYSASTTTRISTRPLTCNTSRGRTGRGSASTGVTIAAWWPVRCRAREAIARTGRTGRMPSWTFPA